MGAVDVTAPRWRKTAPATGGPDDKLIITPFGEALLRGENLQRARDLAQQAMTAEELTGDLFADCTWACRRCGRPLLSGALVDGEACPDCLMVQ